MNAVIICPKAAFVFKPVDYHDIRYLQAGP